MPSQADVLNVGGPNPNHSQIAQAVAAAAEGDVIRVWPGTYDPFAVVGNSLSIVPASPGTPFVVNGLVEVRDLLPGQAFELHGLTGNGVLDNPRIHMRDCLGAVRIYDCDFRGVGSNLPRGVACIVERCVNVSMVHCSLTGGTGYGDELGGFPGFAGVYLADSYASLVRCSALGGRGGDTTNCGSLTCGPGGRGGAGVEAVGVGYLFASGCIFQAGQAGSPNGARGRSIQTAPASTGTQVELAFLQCVLLDPTEVLAPSTETFVPGLTRRLSGPALAPESGSLPIVVQGAPGDRVGLFVGSGYDFRFGVPTGPLLVDVPRGPRWGTWRYLGVVPPSGVLATNLPTPALPPFGHKKLLLVATTLSSTESHFTNSISPIVLDGAW